MLYPPTLHDFPPSLPSPPPPLPAPSTTHPSPPLPSLPPPHREQSRNAEMMVQMNMVSTLLHRLQERDVEEKTKKEICDTMAVLFRGCLTQNDLRRCVCVPCVCVCVSVCLCVPVCVYVPVCAWCVCGVCMHACAQGGTMFQVTFKLTFP